MLRQSIIHVEQDDIDFDEEELEGEREGDRRPRAQTESQETQDVEMSGAGDESHTEGATGPGISSRGPSTVPEQAPPPPKRKMVINHDKYLRLQSLIVHRLSEVERDTGRGMDRDELVDWYLELVEEEIQDVEELEYEKELITKMLRKLVRVSLDFRLDD